MLSDGCGQLPAGTSCAIVVSYDGGTVGNPNHHAVLKIPNDDGLAPQLSVSLFGEVGRVEGANRRPVVLENLPDRSLAAAGMLELDVSGAFADPDGEVLSYTVSSSAPQVVATRVAGALVTLTAASEGVAAIRVTATDPGGLSAAQAFAVVAVSDPGLTSEQYGRYRETWQALAGDAIVPGATPVRASHFTELRSRIDAVRAVAGLAAYGWTDEVLAAGATPIRLVHLLELRVALEAAYTASGRPAPRWTDTAPVAGTTPIRAAHLVELRAAAAALE